MALLTTLAFQNCSDPGFQPAYFTSLASSLPPSPLATPTPTPSPTATPNPELKTWDDPFPAGLETSGNCLDDSTYNLCIADRDPVTANGAAFAPNPFTTTNATSAQERHVFRWGLKVPTTTPSNRHYFLKPDNGLKVVSLTTNNNWKWPYLNDTNHYVSQLHMFYWINRERQYFIERVGHFYYDYDTVGAKIALHAYNSTIQDNAYFSRQDYSINFGYASFPGGFKADFALDATVLAHEAGHGDFFFGNNGGSIDNVTTCRDDLGGNCFCPTKNGCMGAIDEGQADTHAFILFKGEASLGRYATNDLIGIRNAADDYRSQTAQSLFDMLPAPNFPKGEIHNMGEVYSGIWYGFWKEYKDMGQEKDVEVLFSEHLTTLAGNETFLTAFTAINTTAHQIFDKAKADAMIASLRAKYVKMGLNPP